MYALETEFDLRFVYSEFKLLLRSLLYKPLLSWFKDSLWKAFKIE